MTASHVALGVARGERSARRAERRPRRARLRPTALLREGVLLLAATAGGLSLLWTFGAPLVGLSLVTLQTGSMSPGMPAGTLAVVRAVPALELEPGQVATLQRDDASLPVTHRVVGVEPVDGRPATASVTMRGDDNDRDDLLPYVVEEARLVLASAPGAGTLLGALRDPAVLGALTVLAAGVLLRAFWPKRPAVLAAHRRSRRSG